MMLQSEAFPVVFFMLSYYAFAIALLYVLARSWQKAVSGRTNRACDSASELDLRNFPHDVAAAANRTPNKTAILSPRDATNKR